MNAKEIKQKLEDLSKQEAKLTEDVKATLAYLSKLRGAALELSGKHKLLEELHEEQLKKEQEQPKE